MELTMQTGKPDTEPKKPEILSRPFEYKALPKQEDSDNFYFEGYLATWGNIDRYDDVLIKGCFDESLKKIWPKLLWQHSFKEVVGIFLYLKNDDKGLFVKGKMPKADSLVAGRVIPQMKVGSVQSMSIGFKALDFTYDDDGVRIIKKAALIEGSLVDIPVNELAQVTDMKQFDIGDVEQVKTRRDFEKLLRESGAFSKKSVVYLASRFMEAQPSDSATSRDTSALASELKQFANKIKTL